MSQGCHLCHCSQRRSERPPRHKLKACKIVLGTQARTAQVSQGHSELIAIALLFAFTFSSLDANFLVVLLEGSKILASLTELTFFHSLADIPVKKCTFAVHEIELVVDAGEHFGDCSRVGDHAASAHDLGQITAWHHCGWLVIDSALEASRRPIHELNGALGLDCGHGGVNIFGYHIATVHHAARHVLAVTWIALHKHGGRLEDGHGDLCHRELLMVCFLCRNDRCIAGKHEVDAWVWHQICLELCDVDIECTIEAQGGRERGDDLRQETVQVGVCRALNVQVTTADIIESFVVIHDGHVRVFKQ